MLQTRVRLTASFVTLHKVPIELETMLISFRKMKRYLPFDYPPECAHWFYSEQYLLAASLLAGHRNYEVLLPNYYITLTERVRQVMDDFWNRPELAEVPIAGGSFWIEII